MGNVRSITIFACIVALLATVALQNAHAKTSVTPDQARAIAKEAYVYANPVVDSYRIIYGSWTFPNIEPVR